MFLRRYRRNKDGKVHTYFALVESVRTDAGPRQRVVAHLGELNANDERRWQRTVVFHNRQGDAEQLRLFPDDEDISLPDDPDVVRMDRFPNKHLGFGIGQHRCIGSFLARMMFEVLITEVLKRLPDYKIVEEEIIPYPSIGVTNGWIHIPVTFTPGKKVGVDL